MPLWAIDRAPVGTHLGAGFKSAHGLRAWFSPGELKNLEGRGYYPGFLEVDGLIWERPEQVFFFRFQPLRLEFTRITLRALQDFRG